MTEKSQRVLLGRIVAATASAATSSSTAIRATRATLPPTARSSPRTGASAVDIKVVRVTPKGVVARIAGVADRNGAEALKGTALYAPRARLPAAAEGEFYHADLAGLRADNEAGERSGRRRRAELRRRRLCSSCGSTGSTPAELIPFTDAYVPVVDIAAGRVVVVMPTRRRRR